jgi:hypothetical protein
VTNPALKREPKGKSTGGQFAPDVNPESDLQLDDRIEGLPEAVLSERGRWSIEHASKPKPLDRGNGVMSTTMNLAGEPSANTDIAARHAAYPKPDDLDDRLQAAVASGEPVTILKVSEGYFGGGIPSIMQGKLFNGRSGQIGFLPTGKRTQGIVLKGALDMVDNAKPAAVAELNRRWYEETHLPPTVPLALDALKSATEENPIAVLYTHPGFEPDQRTPGCVWYIDYYEEDEDGEPGSGIAGGYLWCPEDSGLYSEHGSTYGKDILKDGALVSTKPKINFAGMMELPSDRLGAYSQLFG